MMDDGTRREPAHAHGPQCGLESEPQILRCLECELLFESGIADSSDRRSERCPQCGLQNAVAAGELDDDAFVIRHSSRFR